MNPQKLVWEEADEFITVRLFQQSIPLNVDHASPLPLIVQKFSTKSLKRVPDVDAFV